MFLLTGLALVVGGAIGVARGGRPRRIGQHRLRAWWLVLTGFALQVATDHLPVGSLGNVMVIVGAVLLLVFAALNPQLVGIGVVAVGVAANALVISLNNGMPVRPGAVVAAGLATTAEEPALAYGYRHHRETGDDRLTALADIIPVPPVRAVVSFGDLILAIGVAATICNLLDAGPRHASVPSAATDPSAALEQTGTHPPALVNAPAEAGVGLFPVPVVRTKPSDPILARRAQWARLAGVGQRAGYLFLLVAIVAFIAGFATGFPTVAVTTSIVGLVGACVVLPPAIVAGYAVKAAEREDRQAGRL